MLNSNTLKSQPKLWFWLR